MEPIPLDILLYITQFLPEVCIESMMGVNSMFLDMAMDIRYQEVSLVSIQPTTMKLLTRLSDPFVAKRVKRLHIRLDHFNKGEMRRRPIRLHPSIIQRLTAILRIPLFNRSTTKPDAALTNLMPFDILVKGLSSIFPKLVNVEEFSVDSWNWHPTFDGVLFFKGAWASFGKKLRKVTLGGNLEGYRVFINSEPPFKSVRELSLEFTNSLARPADDGVDREILLTSVAPFLNNLSHQLASLKVWSWASVHLSSFFANLSSFPSLESLLVRAVFNKAFRDDPSGLKKFLVVSTPSLRELVLRLNSTGFNLDPDSDVRLSEWLWSTIRDNEKVAKGLRTLQIYPTSAERGFDTLITCIRRSSGSLRRLIVHDRYLQFDEVKEIVRALKPDSGLTFLRINVWQLNTALLDLLAGGMPCLNYLTLNVADIRTGDPSAMNEIFREEVRQHDYENWKLYDIGIWQGGSKVDYGTMATIASRIPSLRSFWDEGHMEEP